MVVKLLLFLSFYWRFLPSHHRFRNNKKEFLKGKTKRDVALLVLSGEEEYDEFSQYKGIVFSFYFGKQK